MKFHVIQSINSKYFLIRIVWIMIHNVIWRCEISQYSNYIALRYFTSPTSLTWVTLLCTVLPLIFYWYISSPMSPTWDMSNIAALLLSEMFLLITSIIFNGFSKKVLESWDLGLFSHTIKSYVFDINSIIALRCTWSISNISNML